MSHLLRANQDGVGTHVGLSAGGDQRLHTCACVTFQDHVYHLFVPARISSIINTDRVSIREIEMVITGVKRKQKHMCPPGRVAQQSRCILYFGTPVIRGNTWNMSLTGPIIGAKESHAFRCGPSPWPVLSIDCPTHEAVHARHACADIGDADPVAVTGLAETSGHAYTLLRSKAGN